MNEARFTRILGAFTLLASVSTLCIAQDAPTDPLAAMASEESLAENASASAADQAVTTASDADAAVARADMADRFGVDALAAGQYRWARDIPATGPTKIIISLSDQLAFVYRGDELIGVSTVSSGKTDHETPTGTFPILAKERVHRSQKYDDAPMPYMQRLNQYGVALHGGHLPGYPASHGCIRLPMEFAAKLFNLTSTGSAVIIEA
ncbi:L,D-transpeptidase family protein [Sphingomonas sp.]|uniref:L,D-transpeptidase family protein n=1 Tax=Sphingomonas sp. TaxID=28214 RepID=UPI00286D1D55|nr:L,D-transpeptidase family protein [Sphingomonas sp.]